MAERFNLTAQLQLQAPRNVGQVVGQIRRQLQGVTANVQVKGDARAVAKVNKELRNVDKSARGSAAAVGKLNFVSGRFFCPEDQAGPRHSS